jgi:hypothetical protein
MQKLTPGGEVDGLLVSLLGHKLLLVGCQAATDGTSLLVTEVKGKVCEFVSMCM